MPFHLKRSFNLEKVYADLIDGSGNCFIIYLAKLDIYFIRFWYFGVLNACSDNDIFEKTSFRKFQMPAISEVLSVDNKEMQIYGTWKRVNDPIRLSVYSDGNKRRVTWTCHHPKAVTEIRFRDKMIKGLGYAETLTLPIFPGKLKIEELRWGRFLSENQTIIWLMIKGSCNLSNVYYNGKEFNDLKFEQDSVTFGKDHFRIKLEDIHILRKGRLNDVLKEMPFVKLLFSERIMNTLEIKYKAKASFHENTKILSQGRTIFEIVQWVK